MSVQNKERVTRRLIAIMVLCVGLFAAGTAFAEEAPVQRASNAGPIAQTNCVILERMGTVSQVTSRVLSFGARGTEFQFVEGNLPVGVSFHNKLTERDVRKLQATGSDVIVLDADYLPTSLMAAREGCLKAARKTSAPMITAEVVIASSPSGSDIEIDGKFVGSTPSLVKVSAGDHTVRLTKDGYTAWERTLTTMAGDVRIAPDLQPVAAAAASAATSIDETTGNLDTIANNRF